MDNPGEILRLCRLCLVKDQVNIPIFEEQGDIRQIFLKISSCLPVKVSLEDKLPKRICDGCSNKLDLLYEFWNTSANAEKTLLSWLGQAGVKDADETISAVAQQIAKPAETQVKQEALDEGHASNQVHDSFGVQSFDEEAKDESEAPPPKRARRTAAVKAQINLTPESDEDDDMDSAEAMTKVEDESDESDGEDKDPSYGEIPGTSADDQAGPSGVGKDGVEAPLVEEITGGSVPNDNDKTDGHQPDKTPDVIVVQVTSNTANMTTNAKKDEKVVAAENNKTKQLVTKLYCNKCGELFNNFEDLMRHIFFPTKEEHFFRCNCCKYNVGNTVMDLIQHATEFCGLANHRKNEVIASEQFPNTYRYYCDICGNGYIGLTALQDHQKYHNNELLCCSFCPRNFESFSKLWKHSRLHTVDFNVKLTCTLCSLRFFSVVPYQLHYFLVHSQLIHIPFECSLCPRVIIDDPHTFFLHVQQHVAVTKREDIPKDQMLGTLAKNTCEVCAEILENKNACELHKAEKHNLESKINRKCPFCPNMLDLYSIIVHLKKHRIDKFKAVPIQNDYKVIKNAKTHFALGCKLPQQLKCLQCNKLFREPLSLKQHELTHANMNVSDLSMLSSMQPSTSTSMSYVQSLNSYLPQPECNDCNKTFLSVEALNEHKKIHYLSSEMTIITAGHSAEHNKDTYLANNMHRTTTDIDLNYLSQTPSTFVPRKKPYSSGEILDKESFLETSVREDQTGYGLRELSPQHRQYPYVSTRDRPPTSSGQESDPHWTRINRNENASSSRVGEYQSFSSNNCSLRDNSSSSRDNPYFRDNWSLGDNRYSRDNRSFGDNRYSRDSRSNYNLDSLDNRSSRDNRFSRDNFPLRDNGSGDNLYSRDGRHNQPNQDGQYDGYFGVYKKK